MLGLKLNSLITKDGLAEADLSVLSLPLFDGGRSSYESETMLRLPLKDESSRSSTALFMSSLSLILISGISSINPSLVSRVPFEFWVFRFRILSVLTFEFNLQSIPISGILSVSLSWYLLLFFILRLSFTSGRSF